MSLAFTIAAFAAWIVITGMLVAEMRHQDRRPPELDEFHKRVDTHYDEGNGL